MNDENHKYNCVTNVYRQSRYFVLNYFYQYKIKIMKKFNYLLIVAIVALSGFLVTSCEKEKTEINMIVKNWTLETKTVASVDVITICENNSKWNFKGDGTYAIYDDCDNTQTGTWSLAEDGKTLTLDNNTFYQVIENSILKLVIELQVGDLGLVRWTFN